MPRSAIALLLSGWLAVSAQQPPAQDAASGPQKDLVISTTTQLVVEDVLIKGKDGKPVLGLKPSDFTITEDGKPQKISVFEFQTLEEELAGASSGPPKSPTVSAAPKPVENSGVKPLVR